MRGWGRRFECWWRHVCVIVRSSCRDRELRGDIDQRNRSILTSARRARANDSKRFCLFYHARLSQCVHIRRILESKITQSVRYIASYFPQRPRRDIDARDSTAAAPPPQLPRAAERTLSTSTSHKPQEATHRQRSSRCCTLFQNPEAWTGCHVVSSILRLVFCWVCCCFYQAALQASGDWVGNGTG